MFTRFTWRGVPILDIHKWAKDRGERMVNYEGSRQTVYGLETIQGEMPESFWNNLLMSGGWHYKELV